MQVHFTLYSSGIMLVISDATVHSAPTPPNLCARLLNLPRYHIYRKADGPSHDGKEDASNIQKKKVNLRHDNLFASLHPLDSNYALCVPTQTKDQIEFEASSAVALCSNIDWS